MYKQYVDYGFEPEMVVPDDLQYYPLSGRFIKKSALEQRGFRITKKTAYKDYIAAFVGKFKDETDGMPIREYVGLRPKMYSLTYGAVDDKEKHKATGKGIKRSHLKANIKHADYKLKVHPLSI